MDERQSDSYFLTCEKYYVFELLIMAGGMMGAKFTKEDLLALNKKLSRIKAPKK